MGSGRRQVIWSAQAALALDEAVAYVSQDSPAAGLQLLEKALESASSLAEFSERGRVVPEAGSPTIREIIVFKYRLMYELAEGDVQVIAFLRRSRVRQVATWPVSPCLVRDVQSNYALQPPVSGVTPVANSSNRRATRPAAERRR